MQDPLDDLMSGVRNFLDGCGGGPAAGFVSGIGWSMPRRNLAPRPLSCLSRLDRIAAIAPPPGRALAALLRDRGRDMHWGQTYTAADFGQRFIDNYGWVELFGTRGHFANDRMAGGFLILGPGIEYPDHHHVAEELYVPLTGSTFWRMGDGAWRVREAGEVIHHASNVSHAMRTGDESLLAFYLWRGGPLAARSTVTGTTNPGTAGEA